MPPSVASYIVQIGIAGLFWLNRDQKARVSASLWIPTIWMYIVCSRPVGVWFHMGPAATDVAQVMDGSPIDEAVYTCLLAAAIVVLARRGSRLSRVLSSNKPLFLFFTYCVLSLVWSDFPWVAMKRLIKAVADVLMILVVVTETDRSEALRKLLARLAFVLIPLSILFIKYYPELGMQYNEWTGGTIFTGVTVNKNTLGVVCLCLGLASLWQILTLFDDPNRNGRNRRLLAHGTILAMVIYLFRLMDAMTSTSTFVMAVVLLMVSRSRLALRRPLVIHLLLGSMVVVSASVVFLGASPEALRAMGRNPTLTDRTILWRELLTQVQNPVLGTGYDSFFLGPRLDALWHLEPDLRPNEAHDGYLEVFLNLGWAGLALLAIVIVTGYQTVIRAWRHNTSTESLKLTYFFVILVFNFTEAAFFKIQAVAWLFCLIAIIRLPPNRDVKTQTLRLDCDSWSWSARSA